ncbi:nuclease-related domain-containing DEAD/DEAH box helicase [Niallia sp. MER TA 168]|uniref:NERD domain-containing protein n=1 Tax=Niallia sp. MER TA 168 TaxID=2939568 RepID=UPI002040E1BB|nr:nuclease-related domain-containing DEAD/DEAH box helicase [Niallia sp. MER TA 168]MCM3362257.1 NERD domain-containing protein [Niallia sp. MER TA 168]
MPATIIENYNPNDPRTEGENYLLGVFRTSPRFEGWTVFEQPHINSMKPDFVLTHPQKGILIIEVKDWNLNSEVYNRSGYIRGTDGNYYKSNPINQVEYYKKNILHYQLLSSVNLSERFSRYFSCIETVVYFHCATKQSAMNYCNAFDSHTKIWTKPDIDYIKCTENRLNHYEHTYALSRYNSSFTQNGLLENLVSELNLQLQHADYNYERRQPFILTSDQKRLARLYPGSIRRWSGVAGSGKSVIITEKAVQAAKLDKQVLILSYNITLRHYLRDLCSQQFGPGNFQGERKKLKSQITISHFHDFLKLILTEHQLEVNFEEENEHEGFEIQLMKTANDYFQSHAIKPHFKFDYVLIDEGQDFKADWIRFLKSFFTGNGELFIVYDKAQNLYGHGVWIEDSEQIKDIGFKGKPGHLKYTHRLPNKIVQKIGMIRRKLQLDGDEIFLAKQEQESFFQKTFWFNYRPRTRLEKLQQIDQNLRNLCRTNQLEDITILTTNENTGAEIVKYVSMLGAETSHVYDLNRQQDRERRRVEKWKFQGGTGRLKVCSFHSFKGWQTPNLLLILDSPTTNYNGEQIIMGNTPIEAVQNALFISMSRVKGRADNGEYTFTCLNYLPGYEHLSSIFDEQYDVDLPF